METLRRGHFAELERRRVEEEQQEARRRKLHEEAQLLGEANVAVVDDVELSTRKRKRPSVRLMNWNRHYPPLTLSFLSASGRLCCIGFETATRHL